MRASRRGSRGSKPNTALHLQHVSAFYNRFLLASVVMLAVCIGYLAVNHSHAATLCTVSAKLVNSCRPWFGGTAHNNPGTPTEIANNNAPATDGVSQLQYLEKLIGPNANLDFYRAYNNCSASGTPPVITCQYGWPLDPSGAEYYFATHGKYVNINWKPEYYWANATGGGANPTPVQQAVNAEIATVADSFLSMQHNQPSARFLLTINHEPQGDVTASTTSCPTRGKDHGSPTEYRQMWQNVETIFKNKGVTNVLWTMDYFPQPQDAFDCIVPELWPGANMVDWILVDVYGSNNHPTWAGSTGMMYTNVQSLQGLTNPDGVTIDVNNKPWGVGEFGNCGDKPDPKANPPITVQDTIDSSRKYYDDAKLSFDNNLYPKYELYMVWADQIGGNGGSECLTDYDVPDTADPNGIYDPIKQQKFNAFANDVLNSTTFTTPTPSISSPPPTPTPSCAPIEGDINHNCHVGATDLSILLSDWGGSNPVADLNHDGSVTLLDLSILLSHWSP